MPSGLPFFKIEEEFWMNRRQVLSRAIGTALTVGLLTAPFAVALPQLTVFVSHAEAGAAVGGQRNLGQGAAEHQDHQRQRQPA